jgi:hypothetical protein
MPWRDTQSSRLRRLFLEGFSAMDVAEPLVSFDETAKAETVCQFMQEKRFALVGVRKKGLVEGYVRREDLISGTCGDHFQPFTPEDDLVPDTANLIDVVNSLAINQQCFVTILDRVGAIITLTDLEKPPMRLSEKRLEMAKKLQEERNRRGQQVELLDCLQFGDKGWILTYDEELRESLGHKSRRETRNAIKEFETLRNNLAHTQEIIPSGVTWIERLRLSTSDKRRARDELAE